MYGTMCKNKRLPVKHKDMKNHKLLERNQNLLKLVCEEIIVP